MRTRWARSSAWRSHFARNAFGHVVRLPAPLPHEKEQGYVPARPADLLTRRHIQASNGNTLTAATWPQERLQLRHAGNSSRRGPAFTITCKAHAVTPTHLFYAPRAHDQAQEHANVLAAPEVVTLSLLNGAFAGSF